MSFFKEQQTSKRVWRSDVFCRKCKEATRLISFYVRMYWYKLFDCVVYTKKYFCLGVKGN